MGMSPAELMLGFDGGSPKDDDRDEKSAYGNEAKI